MTKYHAVMVDETNCEFGVDVEASSFDEATTILEENYPESRVEQLESPEQSHKRERRMMAHIKAGGDWDDEGRPIFHN